MKKIIYLFLCMLVASLSACNDNEKIDLPDITVNFQATEIGMDDDGKADITLTLSRATPQAITVIIKLESEEVEYETDYTTNPTVSNGTVTVYIDANGTTGVFTVERINSVFFEGTEKLNLTIQSISLSEGYVIGSKNEASLTFGTIVSSGDTMILEGKDLSSEYANVVYVDLSRNDQYIILRKIWDLSFYCGSEYRVFLNAANGVTAVKSNKTDIRAITLEDAENALNLNASMGTINPEIVDEQDGSLSGTAIAEISANPQENFVYFVNSDNIKALTNPTRSDWYKVKIDRSGNGGYTVQYGTVGSPYEIQTVNVAKSSKQNLMGLSLETGNVGPTEPEAKKWDIMYGYGLGQYNNIPMFMQDYVSLNTLGGAEAAVVTENEIAYENFSRSNLSSLSFTSDRSVIGSDWRRTMPPATGVYNDRFYVIKDPAGNYYKLKFLTMGLNNDGGERGRPKITYQRIE